MPDLGPGIAQARVQGTELGRLLPAAVVDGLAGLVGEL